jgi:N-acetylglucosaminyldiphosphoundecaprenol N-acetyl-beta-D-mannosaminyltransferase
MQPQLISIHNPEKTSVLGVRISTTDYAEVVDLTRHWVMENRADRNLQARYVCLTSVHGVVSAVKNTGVKSALNGADVAAPDGMPVVWALRSFGSDIQTRVYGPDLMLALVEDAERCGHRIFLYGATEATLAQLRANLLSRFPRLNIVGAVSPPFRKLTAEEDEAAVRMLRNSGADLVFVGMSTPKQDLWMAEHASRLSGLVLFGVGAAFNFHAGVVRQAPAWMQRNGLEWFFRLCMEPARLWRRYLIETPIFLPLWALQKLGILKFQ